MASILYSVFSTLKVCIGRSSSLVKVIGLSPPSYHHTQVRTRYLNWQMRRDGIRRDMIKKQFPERLRLNAVRKNNILPKELQEVADVEIDALPRDSSIVRVRNRCVVTSRPRGVQTRWRLSRIVWRHLADYNKMSGVKRAAW